MPFKHSCFISYRHPNHQLGQRIVNELYTGLCSELELMTDKDVYLDYEGLKGGDLYNEALAIELFHSVCMIVIYTPSYFSLDHTYCAREYKAMENLEEERFKLLSNPADRMKGLILPIVFRGVDRIPDTIKSRRQFYDFSGFLASDVGLHKHHKYSAEIKNVAQDVFDRCNIFEKLKSDPCPTSGDGFLLPSTEEIKSWIESMIPGTQIFPGREINL